MDNDGQTEPTLDFLAPASTAPQTPEPGQVAPQVQTQEPPVAPPAVDPAQAPPPVTPEVRQQPQVPLPEHLQERHRRQEAERRAAYLEGILQARQEQQRQQEPQPQPIDPNIDPGAAFQLLEQRLAQRDQQLQEMALHQRANTSEMLARQKHGDEVVDQAIDLAIKSGLNQHFMKQPDPYRALIDWNNSQRIAQEIGNDPNAYRARVEAEVRAKILHEMRTGTPPPRNLPPSLASATKANTAPEVMPEASDFFKSMMNRKG